MIILIPVIISVIFFAGFIIIEFVIDKTPYFRYNVGDKVNVINNGLNQILEIVARQKPDMYRCFDGREYKWYQQDNLISA